MPVYEYICNTCKNKFELLRSFSQAAEDANCPRCNNQAKRVISVCFSRSGGESGLSEESAGTSSGSSCSSCSGGSCSTCGH